jgi:hypothetical protein
VLEALDEGILQDLLGKRAIADTAFDEREELAMTRDERRESFGSVRWGRLAVRHRAVEV